VAGLGAVSRLVHAGRPALLRWLPDSLFHYYLSTARQVSSRSWNFASFTDRIVCFVQSSIDGRRALPVAHPRSSSTPPGAHTNQSPQPCSGSFHNWLLLSIRVVVSVPCQISYATAHYWNIRTLPRLSTMCQDDDAHSVLSTSYSKNYEQSQAVAYEGCVGMNVALVSIRFFINLKRLKALSVRDRKVHVALKSMRTNTLAHMNEGNRPSRVNGQESAAEMQLEMDSRVGRFAQDK
jgi:hypothetical protein